MTPPLLLTRDGPLATLTLNRPESLNALDFSLMDALVDAAADVAGDDALRVVVVRGAGKHFMAGGDIRTFAGMLDSESAERTKRFRRMISRLHSAIESFHRMPHPVIGQVQGAVAGFGLSLMNACDLVVAADNAYFASAYRAIALTRGRRRLVGAAAPRWNAPRDGDHAARRALRRAAGDGVGPREPRRPAGRGRRDRRGHGASRSPTGRCSPSAMPSASMRESLGRSLSEQLDAEAASFSACAGTPDFAEGIAAFLEKRPAQFAK